MKAGVNLLSRIHWFDQLQNDEHRAMNRLIKLLINTVSAQPFGVLSGLILFVSVVVLGGWFYSLADIQMNRPAALLLIAVSAVIGWQGSRFISRRSGSPWDEEISQERGSMLAGLVFMAGLLVWAILLVNAYVHEDPSWDGNVYHVPAIGLWHQEGRLHWITGDFGSVELMNGYPKTGELFAWIVSVAFGSGWLNALNLFFIPIGFFGLLTLCQILGTNRSSSIIASSLFMFIPVNICQSATTYLDSAYASSVAGLLACLIFGLTIKTTLLNGLVLGCAAGLAIGLKQPGLLLLAIAGALLLITKVWRIKILVATTWTNILIVFLSALCVGGGWYLRNYIYGGSPLYPAALSLFGIELFPGQAVKDMIALDISVPAVMSVWPNYLRIAYTWLQGLENYPHSIVGVDARLGGLGLLWPLIILPTIFSLAILPMMEAGKKNRIFILFLIISLAFLVQPNNWWARYTLWLYVAGIPALAMLLTNVPKRLFNGAVILTLIVAMIDGAASLYYTLRFRGMLPGQQLEGVELSGTFAFPLYPEMSYHMPELVQNTDKIILGPLSGDNTQLLGNLVMPLGRRSVQTITPDPPGHQLDELLNAGYSNVIWDKNWPLPAEFNDRFKVHGEISRFYHLIAKDD